MAGHGVQQRRGGKLSERVEERLEPGDPFMAFVRGLFPKFLELCVSECVDCVPAEEELQLPRVRKMQSPVRAGSGQRVFQQCDQVFRARRCADEAPDLKQKRSRRRQGELHSETVVGNDVPAGKSGGDAANQGLVPGDKCRTLSLLNGFPNRHGNGQRLFPGIGRLDQRH